MKHFSIRKLFGLTFGLMIGAALVGVMAIADGQDNPPKKAEEKKAVPKPKFLTGAKPSARAHLAAAPRHVLTGTAPARLLILPKSISFWLNDSVGDCVTAEEAFAKACSGILIADSTVSTWATQNNVINGATLFQVLTLMSSNGFAQDSNTYNDGQANTVDWTNSTALQNAIASGFINNTGPTPVKIGVAASQLQGAVPNPPKNGWVATGFSTDENLDHCVSLCGYGPMSWLVQQLGGTLPSGVDGTKPGYALFTWNSIGVIDEPSMLAITGEAWVRSPNTKKIGTGSPAPDSVSVVTTPTPPVNPPPPSGGDPDALTINYKTQTVTAGANWIINGGNGSTQLPPLFNSTLIADIMQLIADDAQKKDAVTILGDLLKIYSDIQNLGSATTPLPPPDKKPTPNGKKTTLNQRLDNVIADSRRMSQELDAKPIDREAAKQQLNAVESELAELLKQVQALSKERKKN